MILFCDFSVFVYDVVFWMMILLVDRKWWFSVMLFDCRLNVLMGMILLLSSVISLWVGCMN